MSFREGLSEEDQYTTDTTNTYMDSSPTDTNMDADTKDTIDSPLQKKDAQNIHVRCILPFTNNINDLMKNKYTYQTIYDEIQEKQKKRRKNQNQTELNAYFRDPSSTTIQDIMDKISDNIAFIRENPVFKKNPKASTVINYITNYKRDREIPSSDIKQKYKDCISCIENELKTIANRKENYYSDSNLDDLIKQEKNNPTCYGLNSSFHKLRLYVKAGIENKLNTDENIG